MSFQDVSPGGSWQPEPAARYNAVNSLLRSFTGEQPAANDPADHRTVDFFNNSGQVIRAFTAVAIIQDEYNGSPEVLQSRYYGYTAVRGIPAVNNNFNWGIALEDVDPGCAGSMVVAGVVPAWFTGSGRAVSPSAAGLIAGNSGGAAVISYPKEYPAGNPFPGIILLGSGGAAMPDEYMGQFKISALSPTAASITYPGAEHYCGLTDVPGLEQIPPAEIEIGSGYHRIYLAFYYESENNYSYRFIALPDGEPDDTPLFVWLGTFNNGSVYQALTIGINGRLSLKNEWYL